MKLMSRLRQRCRGDGGSVTVELAVIAPGLLLLLALMIAAGRIALAGGAIDQVASDAARAASISRTAGQARSAATDAAHQVIGEQHLACQDTTVAVDTTGFTVPVGQPAQVRVDVTCAVALSDLALPGLPGTRTLTSTFTSPLDPFRARS